MNSRSLTSPDFVAGKALMLRRLTHSWESALAKAQMYAGAASQKQAKAMWAATADYIQREKMPC